MVLDEDHEDENEERLKVHRRKLTREERETIGDHARPGAVYRESSWQKQSVQGLHRIQEAVDALERPGGRKRDRDGGDLPPGFRSRIRDALGPIAYVERSYTTKDHHICRVGVRTGEAVENAIILVGPESIRRFEDVASAVDAMEEAKTQASVPSQPDGEASGPVREADGEGPFGLVYEVTSVEGVGEVYSEDLAGLGIEDTRDLWSADAGTVSEALDVPKRVVASWQSRAELMAVGGLGPQYAELLERSGVEGIEDLEQRDVDELLALINAKEEELEINIQGSKVTKARVEDWIQRAQEHAPDEESDRERRA